MLETLLKLYELHKFFWHFKKNNVFIVAIPYIFESTITWKFHWLLNKVKFDLHMAFSTLSVTVVCMLNLLYNLSPQEFKTQLFGILQLFVYYSNKLK
jgi:hypothetical protein